MVLPVYIYGSPVLRKAAEEIDKDYPELEKFLDDFWETMYNADGVGLAAPQVGRSIRVFVVDASGGGEQYADFKKTFINPEIYERFGDEEVFNEGCISIPGVHEDVVRPTKIRMRYLDENFTEHDEEFEGYPARVIQHEYDHLEGKMFVDRVSPLRRALLRSKLNGMSKGKYDAGYKTKLVK